MNALVAELIPRLRSLIVIIKTKSVPKFIAILFVIYLSYKYAYEIKKWHQGFLRLKYTTRIGDNINVKNINTLDRKTICNFLVRNIINCNCAFKQHKMSDLSWFSRQFRINLNSLLN